MSLLVMISIGSLTLGKVRAAVWSARARWMNLGRALGLSYKTLQVIKGDAVSHYSQISDLPRIFNPNLKFNTNIPVTKDFHQQVMWYASRLLLDLLAIPTSAKVWLASESRLC